MRNHTYFMENHTHFLQEATWTACPLHLPTTSVCRGGEAQATGQPKPCTPVDVLLVCCIVVGFGVCICILHVKPPELPFVICTCHDITGKENITLRCTLCIYILLVIYILLREEHTTHSPFSSPSSSPSPSLPPSSLPLPRLLRSFLPSSPPSSFSPSLLVELTLPSIHGGFHPTSVSDAFESALLSVRDKEGVRVLWREYLTYLRSQAVDEGVHSFKVGTGQYLLTSKFLLRNYESSVFSS